MKKNFLLTTLILGLISLSVALYFYNKQVGSVSGFKTEITISAEDLLSAYEADEMKANELYLDKVIEVSGKIAKVQEEEVTTVYLDTGSDFSQIICQLEDAEYVIPPIGENVKIKGICSGYLMDVVIVRGIIVEN